MARQSPELVRAANPVAEAATRTAQALEGIVAGSPRLAVSGGSALRVLGPLRSRLSPALWAETRLTWVDERCVPTSDAQSNRGTAIRSGNLDPRHPPRYELPLFLDDETPLEACVRVAAQLALSFGDALDVVLLGMGEDGHIASLFPGRPELDAPGSVIAIGDSPKPPPQRITLTMPTLLSARGAILVATGEAKRHALERVLVRDPGLPASAFPSLTIVTDLEF